MSDPNWYPDPMGRYELRYYDGVQWTAHVATAGVAGTDPLPDPQSAVGASNQAPSAGFDPAAQGLANQTGAEVPPGFGTQPPQEHWQNPPASSGSNKGVLGLLAALGAVVLLFGVGAFLVFGGDGDDDGVEAVAGDDADSDTDGADSTDEPGSTTTEGASSTTADTVTSTVTSEETSSTTTVGAPPIGGVPAAADPRAVIPEYGSDPMFDALADACEQGEMQACDDLFIESPLGSGYEAYGDTCGQRNEPSAYCTTIYPGAS